MACSKFPAPKNSGGRAECSLAIAIQSLAWGIGQLIFGVLVERIGNRRAIIIGAASLMLSANSGTPLEHQADVWLVGFDIAGTGFGVIIAVVGRVSWVDNLPMSLAIATAAGGTRQVLGAPVTEWMLTVLTWQSTFRVCAAVILSTIRTPPLVRASAQASKTELEETLGQILVKRSKIRPIG